MPRRSRLIRCTAVLALLAASTVGTSQAADWSDTSLSYRYGTKFAEPFNDNDITKNIVNFSHVSGYKYGKNFFSVDLLMSSNLDPSSAGSNSGAHEAYAVYRHTLDFGKIAGKSYAFGPVRGVAWLVKVLYGAFDSQIASTLTSRKPGTSNIKVGPATTMRFLEL